MRLEDDAPARGDRRKAEREGLGGAVDLGSGDALQPLAARLGLPRACPCAPALDESLKAGDLGGGPLGLLGLDRGREGPLLAEPRVPEGPQLAAAPIQLEYGGGDRLEEVAVVRDEHHRTAHLGDRILEPLGALHVQVVGRLVQEQDVGPCDQGAGERRAGELTAREDRQRVGQARVRDTQPPRDAHHPGAPVVPAGALQGRVRALVGREDLGAGVPGGHAGLELGELGLGRDGVGHAFCDVLLERATGDLQRGTLVVQSDPGALGQADPARVGRQLAGDDPQQRGLALAVAPDDRQAISGSDAERDLMQDPARTEALGDLNDFHKRVG